MHRNLRGTDLHSPTNELVENTTGSSISALKVVKYTGVGVYPKIEPVSSSNEIARGITQSAINDGGTGYITCLGFMFGVNTNSYNVGDKLYASAGGSLTTAAAGLPVAYVLKKDPVNGILYVANTGVSTDDIAAASFPPQAQIRLMWSVAYPFAYSEYVYNGTGDIVDFNVWSDNTKTLQLFNKHFVHLPNGDLTQIVTTFYLTGDTLTRDLVYDGNGQMISTQDS